MNSKNCSSDKITLCLRVGVKRRSDRKGSTVHRKVRCTLVIKLQLFGAVVVKRRSEKRGNTLNGTVSRAAVIILVLVGWKGFGEVW